MQRKVMRTKSARKTKKWMRLGILAVFAVLVISLLVAIVYPYLVPASVVLSKAPIPSGASAAAFRGGVAVLQDASLVYYRANGTKQWSAAAEGLAGLACGTNYIAAYSSSDVRGFQAGGREMFSYRAEQPIVGVRCSDAGVLLLLAQDGNYTLVMLDLSGRETERIALGTETVVDFHYNESNKSIWVMALLKNVVVPQTQITIYKSKAISGIINIYDQTATGILQKENQFLVVGTDQVLCYNEMWKVQYQHLVYGWHMLDGDFVKNRAYILLGTNSGSALSAVRVLAPAQSNTTDVTVRMEPGCFEALLYNGKVYSVLPETVEVYSLSGQKECSYNLRIPVEDVRPLDGNLCLATSGGQTYIMQLP